jgi:hypothetical protein
MVLLCCLRLAAFPGPPGWGDAQWHARPEQRCSPAGKACSTLQLLTCVLLPPACSPPARLPVQRWQPLLPDAHGGMPRLRRRRSWWAAACCNCRPCSTCTHNRRLYCCPTARDRGPCIPLHKRLPPAVSCMRAWPASRAPPPRPLVCVPPAAPSDLWGCSGELYSPRGRLLDWSYAGYAASTMQLPTPDTYSQVRRWLGAGQRRKRGAQGCDAALPVALPGLPFGCSCCMCCMWCAVM